MLRQMRCCPTYFLQWHAVKKKNCAACGRQHVVLEKPTTVTVDELPRCFDMYLSSLDSREQTLVDSPNPKHKIIKSKP